MRPAFFLTIALLPACEQRRAPAVPIPTPPKALVAPSSTWTDLGRQLFFDPLLSNPPGQSCASCHDPATAFSDPLHRAISPGAAHGALGNRNAPTLLYAKHIPPFGMDEDDDALPPAPVDDAYAQEVREEALPLQKTGGLFVDGRANSLEAQVAGPLFNPLEMNNPDKAAIADRLRAAPYAHRFADLVDAQALTTPDSALHWASFALATFEQSAAFAPFASRYDAFLAGKEKFTAQESEGLDVFENPKRGNCASCHPNRPQPYDVCPPLFTDHSYHNLGLPPLPGTLPDAGLFAITGDPKDKGQFRTPTLRNIDKTAPYFHNGRSKTLREVVDFYADRPTGKFGPAAFPETMETRRTGNLKLTEAEREALVAFLKTLDDR